MLWIFTVLLFAAGILILPAQPLAGAGVLIVCAILYDKKLRGRPFRLWSPRRRQAKAYSPPKLSRRERRRLEKEQKRENDLLRQLQQEVEERRRQERVNAELQKKVNANEEVRRQSPRMRWNDEIAEEQIRDNKHRQTEAEKKRVENENRNLKNDIKHNKYD